eukprot:INCI7612.4.p1 GENE.INCI7612.4~~INCI7612.4.p1  ORF type:complete len:645 (-),score=68.39 INCI7612.4:179-2113(-)
MPTRMGMGHTVFAPQGSQALPTTDPTIAEMLKPFGYRTGMVGKWHLGLNNVTRDDGAHLPFYRGFDFVGHILPFSNHWACDESGRHFPKPGTDAATDQHRNSTCFVYRNTTIVQQPIDHTTLTETLVADATGFVETSAAVNAPFFLYFPFPQCHVSMFTNTSFTNTSANGIFGDQIREMDWAVGQVLDALQEAGVADHTLVFFTSDNGPHVELCAEGGTTAGLRGGKGDSSWEGGLRMPGIISWPGKLQIPVGSVVDAVVSTLDISATILDVASQEAEMQVASSKSGNSNYPFPDNGLVYDGRSLLPMLLGGNASFGPHDEDGLFHFCGDTLMAVRIGEYKLKYYSEQLPFDNYSQVHCTHGWAHGEFFQGGWDCHGGSVTTLNPPQLLRISSDPAERYSLLDADTWHAHLQWLTGQRRLYNATRGTPHSLLHHGIRGSDSKSKLSIFSVTDDQCPSIINGSVSPASIVTVPGGILKGYAGASLPLPANSSTNELLGACVRRCCEDGSCAAAVMQDVSRNQGEPPGSCALGQPCCWLVDFEHADLPPTPEVNATIGYPRGKSPSPPIVPGPYSNLLKKFAEVVARMNANMTREVIPGQTDLKLEPCCQSAPRIQSEAESCTCGYPGNLAKAGRLNVPANGFSTM